MWKRLTLLAVLLASMAGQYGCAALAGGVVGGAIGAEAAEDDDDD